MGVSRVEGQVRDIERMVHDDRYCIDIITQVSAFRPRSTRSRSGCSTTTPATAWLEAPPPGQAKS
jgi:hypothetical protein